MARGCPLTTQRSRARILSRFERQAPDLIVVVLFWLTV